MALVVFLRGINVGGHRRVRPSLLARELTRFDVVNVGSAGTLVVRRPVSRAALRAELVRPLPFDAHVMICDGREILDLTSRDPFARRRSNRMIIPFASILTRQPRRSPRLPTMLPATGRWSVQVIARRGRFLLGVHRREMKAIGYLGQLDEVFGTTATTRSWSTMLAVRTVLEGN